MGFVAGLLPNGFRIMQPDSENEDAVDENGPREQARVVAGAGGGDRIAEKVFKYLGCNQGAAVWENQAGGGEADPRGEIAADCDERQKKQRASGAQEPRGRSGDL